jgi:hypothetical protein
MKDQRVQNILLDAFLAAGADDGLVYVSVPITSGPREFRLMSELGCSRDRLRREFRTKWLSEVVRPNEEEAIAYAARVRALFPQHLVVEPARLHVAEWGQEDYGNFWETLIRRYAIRVIASPHWAFSVGSTHEIAIALELGLPILDIGGRPLDQSSLAGMASSARQEILRMGFSSEEIEQYLPTLRTPSNAGQATNLEEARANSAHAEVFGWLRAERARQLQYFGPHEDDSHTREGVGLRSWWWRQLTKYHSRAVKLGPQTSEGRLALAKFLTTACALLESVVRVFGRLPMPETHIQPEGRERLTGTDDER